MILSEVVVEIVRPEEEGRFRELMQSHHYLGAMPKIGETLWYVAHVDGTWLALAVFSAPALKCRARDSWVGWDFRYQYGRLHLVSNNSRLLILPGHHYRNLGSRFLGLCARRIVGDWPARFGHPLLLLETFVDPARFQGTVYRAANWQAVGHSRGLPVAALLFQVAIEGVPAREPGKRRHEVPPGIADHPLHIAFVVTLAGTAVAVRDCRGRLILIVARQSRAFLPRTAP